MMKKHIQILAMAVLLLLALPFAVHAAPPVADAGPDRTAQETRPVMFDGSQSSDPDGTGTIATYSWDFGDGSTASGSSSTHAYGRAGRYTVTLTVTDNTGAMASDTATVMITPLPNACFQDPGILTVQECTTCCAGRTQITDVAQEETKKAQAKGAKERLEKALSAIEAKIDALSISESQKTSLKSIYQTLKTKRQLRYADLDNRIVEYNRCFCSQVGSDLGADKLWINPPNWNDPTPGGTPLAGATIDFRFRAKNVGSREFEGATNVNVDFLVDSVSAGMQSVSTALDPTQSTTFSFQIPNGLAAGDHSIKGVILPYAGDVSTTNNEAELVFHVRDQASTRMDLAVSKLYTIPTGSLLLNGDITAKVYVKNIAPATLVAQDQGVFYGTFEVDIYRDEEAVPVATATFDNRLLRAGEETSELRVGPFRFNSLGAHTLKAVVRPVGLPTGVTEETELNNAKVVTKTVGG